MRKPRFTKPAQIVVGEVRRDLRPLYEALGVQQAMRLAQLRAAVDAGKAGKP